MTKSIQKTILQTILQSLGLSIIPSTAAMYVFYDEASAGTHSMFGVVVLINIGFIIIQSLVCLLALFVSRPNISSDKFLIAVVYFLPVVPFVTISAAMLNNPATRNDKVSMMPVFSFLSFALVWAIFYFFRIYSISKSFEKK